MKALLISFAVGLLVGVLYGVIRVKSPAPPIVALLGLLGMVLGEQAGGWLLRKKINTSNVASARLAEKRKDQQQRPNVQSVISAAHYSRLWIIACALTSALRPLAGSGVDWQMSGNDLANDRNQPYETSIDVGNAATLKPAWTFKTLGSCGYVYVPDWGGGLHKLNARTGQIVRSRIVSEYTGWSNSLSRTTPVLADGVLVVARQPQSFGAKHDSSYLLGLNSETDNFLWKVMLDKHPATILTRSPVVYNGVIYVGTSSNEEHWATDTKYECCSFAASMAAVDLKTGNLGATLQQGAHMTT
jgi:XapX domain-containing protein